MSIAVDRQEWEKLDDEAKQKISTIIDTHFSGQTIEAVDSVNATTTLGSVCELACDAAQSLAITECGKLPIGKELCIAAAKAAGDVCRKAC